MRRFAIAPTPIASSMPSLLVPLLVVLLGHGHGSAGFGVSALRPLFATVPSSPSASSATSSGSSTIAPPPTKVLVTGASGRTGQLVFSALLRDKRFEPKALVRSEKSAKKFKKSVPGSHIDQIVICDVTSLPVNDNDNASTNQRQEQPMAAIEGCQSMVICTSAVPTLSKMSLFKAMLKAPFNLLTGKKAIDFRTLKFVWKNNQYPEMVDYRGQVAQIDLAKQLGIKHVVVVSSMGGTDPSNFLNTLGKNAKDGTGNGDILLWKRKAERYLVASGLHYTILHPGGLIDTPGGVEDFVLDVDDKLIKNVKRSISRNDVASLCVAALAIYSNDYGDNEHTSRKVALDCITAAVPSGGTVRTAEVALLDFYKQGKVYDYSL